MDFHNNLINEELRSIRNLFFPSYFSYRLSYFIRKRVIRGKTIPDTEQRQGENSVLDVIKKSWRSVHALLLLLLHEEFYSTRSFSNPPFPPPPSRFVSRPFTVNLTLFSTWTWPFFPSFRKAKVKNRGYRALIRWKWGRNMKTGDDSLWKYESFMACRQD